MTSAGPPPYGGLPPEERLRQAISYHQAERWAEAEQLYRSILSIDPGNPTVLQMLGVLAHQTGRAELAVETLKAAVTANPAVPQPHLTFANILRSQQKFDEARQHYEQALALNPNDVATCCDLGSVLALQGHFDSASACYEQALAMDPNCATALHNLAATRAEQGRPEEAIGLYRQALAITPDVPACHYGLANALRGLGRPEEAISAYERALALQPRFPAALTDLGTLLHEHGKLDDAERLLQEALRVRPDYPEALTNLGNVLSDKGQPDPAISCYERALALRSDLPETLSNLGAALHVRGRISDAVGVIKKALALRPNYATAMRNLGNAFRDQGRLEEAISYYRQALAIQPDNALTYDSLLFLTALQPGLDPEAYLALARTWETHCAPSPDPGSAPDIRWRPLDGRRLRVGFVSGDFRAHAVSHFIEQLFVHLDRSRIELFAYSSSSLKDDTTARLQALTDHWISLVGLSDPAARRHILADAIDVLIDLSGHTAHNRLGLFSLRAAPVQAHYLGFFASTGLSQMDYWLGDANLAPPQLDGQFQETIWRLPRLWVAYDAKNDAPLPCWSPTPDGTIRLGSFNALLKLNSETISCWAELLHALPEARLLLKNRELADPSNRTLMLERFAAHGIDEDRITLADHRATLSWSAHMAYYDHIDIALDPIAGLCGGTTSCDALWMGVPVVTCEGTRVAERMTGAFLHAIGRQEWIARDRQGYIDTVRALARDVDGRKRLRMEQRDRMAQSPLCDPQGLARALEQAFYAMHERAGAGGDGAQR